MPIDKIIVTIIGAAAIGFTYWFFLLKEERVVAASGSIDVHVTGGYSPAVIAVENHKPVTLNFFRTDASSCLEEVVIPEFKIRQYLPVNQKIPITINPKMPGEYPFSCGMNMYHGKIVVK